MPGTTGQGWEGLHDFLKLLFRYVTSAALRQNSASMTSK